MNDLEIKTVKIRSWPDDEIIFERRYAPLTFEIVTNDLMESANDQNGVYGERCSRVMFPIAGL